MQTLSSQQKRARMLTERYVQRAAESGADAVLLLGDTLDPADEEGLVWLRHLIERVTVPVHVVIGNHEVHGAVEAEEFHRSLGLPAHGNRVVRVKGVPLVLLATPDQESLAAGSAELAWLAESLEGLAGEECVLCCAHYSLLLHPCVQGWRNDGMQVLWGAEEVLALLRGHPNVRCWLAGHKNVPSVVEQDGMLHVLSPQLIQSPCGYRVLEVHDEGLRTECVEIEERDLAARSDRAQGRELAERRGEPGDRSFRWSWRANSG